MLITNASLFHPIYQKYNTAILSELELPKRIFNSNYRTFYFFEFDRAISTRFWPLLQKMMVQSKDSHVSIVSIDPHPVDYFFNDFGLFGAVQVDATVTENEYHEEMCSHPPGKHLDSLFHSEVLAWFPDSAKWFIWGERAYGIAILGVQEGYSPSVTSIAEESKMPILSLEEALSDIVSLNFRDSSEFEKFSIELRINYSC